MRLVQAKIFNVNNHYYVIIERIKLTDKSKILEFEYTKLEREVGSFQVTFKFNNIDFELMEK